MQKQHCNTYCTVLHVVRSLSYIMKIGFRFYRPLSHVSWVPIFPIHINFQPKITFDLEQVLRGLGIIEGHIINQANSWFRRLDKVRLYKLAKVESYSDFEIFMTQP